MVEVEETPIINPLTGETESADVIPEAARLFQPAPVSSPSEPTPPPKKQSRFHFGTILFIILLFGLGIWLSTQLRSFFAPATTNEVAVPTASVFPSATLAPTQAASSAIPDSSWIAYSVTSGASYKLPSTVAAPTCDGASCVSRGTGLPNGTRFTVAARGKGQLLPDFRGAILTDAGGKEFVMKQMTVGGIYVYEYVGNFTGRTGGGYTFTAMRGVLVPVNDTLAIEFNHFAPLGVVADFAKDDVLFDKIVGTFSSSSSATTK